MWGPLLAQSQGLDLEVFACPLSETMLAGQGTSSSAHHGQGPQQSAHALGSSASSMETRGQGGTCRPRQDLPTGFFLYLLTLLLHSKAAPGLSRFTGQGCPQRADILSETKLGRWVGYPPILTPTWPRGYLASLHASSFHSVR